MTRPLDTVVELQRAQRDLDRAERLLGGIPEWMEALHAEHENGRGEIECLEEEAAEALKERRRLETEMVDANGKLQHFQQQVSQVRTQREYAALLQEIDTVKAALKTLEDEALAALASSEALQQTLRERREGFTSVEARYAEELAKWEKERPAVAQQVETLRAEVRTLRTALPRGVLALFDRLRSRHGGEAVAEARRADAASGGTLWHCSACNYRVRLKAVGEIRGAGALVQCDGCKRLLHVTEEAP